MKICVLELDGAAPEVVFGDERLGNLRRLMDMGLYGRLTISASNKHFAMWEQLVDEGRKAIILGVPPNFIPDNLKEEIQQLVGDYPVDVRDLSTDRKELLRDKIIAMSQKHWQTVRHLLTNHAWDYFQYVDIGLNRVHQGFENCFDNNHKQHEQGNPYENVIPDYYLWLDEQIGGVMELLDSGTILLIVSVHGAPTLSNGSTQDGLFLLAAPNCPLSGEYSGAQLLDIRPTLLDLAGYGIPESMQGRSLVAGMEKKSPQFDDVGSEQLIHDRLAGLGYI